MKNESENQYKEKPRCYAVLTADVRFDNELSSTAKLLYAEITALSAKEGYCFANNAYFAWLYGISERQVISCIKALEKRGHVRSVCENNQRKIFVCSSEGMKIISGGMKKTSAGSAEKFISRGEKTSPIIIKNIII